jgi:chromosome partitioning protein
VADSVPNHSQEVGSAGGDDGILILAIANQKGGVGKTTTAINLSAALAQRGLPTLLVDLDPQGNATLSFLDPEQLHLSVYDALVDENRTLKDAVHKTNIKSLDVIPARISLAKFESKLLGDIDSHFRLKDRLKTLLHDYRYIVIDTPPTLGLLTVNALVASTHLLVPIQSSYFALEGTDDLLETVEKIKARPNPGLEFLGVVITIHDKRTILGRDIKNHIKEVFGSKVFRTIISRSVRLEESPAYKEPIFSFAPHSSGALQYYKLSEEVIGRV